MKTPKIKVKFLPSCDECGEVIESLSGAWVEWLRPRDGTGKPHGLRLLHHVRCIGRNEFHRDMLDHHAEVFFFRRHIQYLCSLGFEGNAVESLIARVWLLRAAPDFKKVIANREECEGFY